MDGGSVYVRVVLGAFGSEVMGVSGEDQQAQSIMCGSGNNQESLQQHLMAVRCRFVQILLVELFYDRYLIERLRVN